MILHHSILGILLFGFMALSHLGLSQQTQHVSFIKSDKMEKNAIPSKLNYKLKVKRKPCH